MSEIEWFRNKTWDEQIEARFNEKLRRARRKSQYLRIQANHLSSSNPVVALALLERYFALGLDFDWAQAFVDQAASLLALGRTEDALISLQKALDREREFPNLKTTAWSMFARVISEQKIRSRYTDALQVLAEVEPSALVFPVHLFTWHATHALILEDLGKLDQARGHAREALAAAKRDSSGFRYHLRVGLVGGSEQDLREKLKAILSPKTMGQRSKAVLDRLMRYTRAE